MNQKEFNLIAEVIRGRKENAAQSFHFGYSQQDIEHALLTIKDLQDFLAYEFRAYPAFDEAKFTQACAI